MRFLPLSLTAHPSAWGVGAVSRMRQDHPLSPEAPCRFCGAFAAGRQEVFHLDGDHDNNAPTNLVAACSLCHLVQHLDEAARQRSVVLVWLPEMSQAALFMLARAAQLTLLTAGEDPTLEARPKRATDATVAAWRALTALHAREEQARSRLLTSDPKVLGAALLALSPRALRGRSDLLDGTRLLPTGRLLADGEDLYPGLLRAWAGSPTPAPARNAA